MAQSFNAISTSLGEAERQKDGKAWTKKDYENHSQRGYKIDPERSDLNTVFVSADGRTERDLVNDFLLEKMKHLNAEKVQAVRDWNKQNAAFIGGQKVDKKGNLRFTKDGKPMLLKKKSVDKRELFPVGEWAGKGKRQMPYDTFKTAIEVGNLRGKEGDTRYRQGILQQFVAGFGNDSEWENDPARHAILSNLKSKDPKRRERAKAEFEKHYVKPYLDQWQKDNPSMHVVQAVVHYDESHPHIQFTVFPWRDGKENGGLGSTSYGGAIKTDHDGMSIANWYQMNHDKIRELITSATPNVVDADGVRVKMTLDATRPGSHKSSRVNVHAAMREALKNQKAFLDKQQAAFDGSKPKSVDVIQQLEPDSMMPADMLPKGSQSAKISTPEGSEQFLAAPATWLLQKAVDALLRAFNAYRTKMALLVADEEEREQKIDNGLSNAYEAGHMAGVRETKQEQQQDESATTQGRNKRNVRTRQEQSDDLQA